MSRQAVIVDTNVVVAGLLTVHEASPVARIFDGTLAAAFPFFVNEALVAEYRTVHVRPNLRKVHGLPGTEADAILTDLALHALARPEADLSMNDDAPPTRWALLCAAAPRRRVP